MRLLSYVVYLYDYGMCSNQARLTRARLAERKPGPSRPGGPMGPLWLGLAG